MYKFIYSLYSAINKTAEHDGIEHAGYMSFMVLLSLFPFIVFFLALTSFFGAFELGQYFVKMFLHSMPEDVSAVLESRMQELLNSPPQSLMTLAIIGTIWTASSFVEGLRTILNRIYCISTPPAYIWRRMLSIIQFLAITLLISFAMFILVLIPAVLRKIPEYQEMMKTINPLWQYLRYITIFFSLFFTVSSLYYILPNAKIKYKNVIPGTILTVILWLVAGVVTSKYLAHYHQLNLIYGSLGSIIITLLFFYIINMIFIYGAEFNYIYNK